MRTRSPGGAGVGGVLPLPTDALTDGGAARARSLGQRGADGQHRTYKRGQSQPGREELGAEEQLILGRRRHSPRRTGRTFRRRRKVQRHDCLGCWVGKPGRSTVLPAALERSGGGSDRKGPGPRRPSTAVAGMLWLLGTPCQGSSSRSPPTPRPLTLPPQERHSLPPPRGPRSGAEHRSEQTNPTEAAAGNGQSLTHATGQMAVSAAGPPEGDPGGPG